LRLHPFKYNPKDFYFFSNWDFEILFGRFFNHLNFSSLPMFLKKLMMYVLLGTMASQTWAGGLEGLWGALVDNDVRRDISKEVARSTDKTIDETLSKINKSMPSKVDGMTTLLGLKRADRTIVYEYVFNVNHSKLTLEARKDLRQRVIDVTCNDSETLSYLRSGKEFLYKYTSLTGDLLLGQKVSMRYCQG
jgi:hypothetical protein